MANCIECNCPNDDFTSKEELKLILANYYAQAKSSNSGGCKIKTGRIEAALTIYELLGFDPSELTGGE